MSAEIGLYPAKLYERGEAPGGKAPLLGVVLFTDPDLAKTAAEVARARGASARVYDRRVGADGVIVHLHIVVYRRRKKGWAKGNVRRALRRLEDRLR